MTLEERSNLVVALARVLYVNGQSTDRLWPRPRDSAALSDSSPRSSRAGESWNLRPRDGDARLVCAVEANPTGVDMDRVASAMRAVEDLGAAPLTPAVAMDMITAISKTPPAPTWLFALAAGMGGVDDAGRFPFQDGERPSAPRRQPAKHVRAHKRDIRGRLDCIPHHSSDKLWPDRSEDGPSIVL